MRQSRHHRKKTYRKKKLTDTERDIIQYITIKQSIHKEDLPILNVLPLTQSTKIQIELEREVGNFTITVGDFRSPLSAIGRMNIPKIAKFVEQDNTISRLDIIVFHTCHLIAAGYTFFLRTHRTFIKITITWVIRQTLTDLKDSKSYKVCSVITMELSR